MWVQSQDGTIYNADKFSFFGVDSQVTTQKPEGKEGSIVSTEWSFYIYGTMRDIDGDFTDYLMASNFPTEEDAQVELNRFLRHIKAGDNIFRFCKED